MLVNKIKNFQKLRKELYNNFGNINDGGCGVFARVLNERFMTNKFLYIFEKESFDQDPPIHVYLKLMKDTFVDICGIYTKKEIRMIYNYNYTFLISNGELLEIYYDELGKGLFSLDYKEYYSFIKKMVFEK